MGIDADESGRPVVEKGPVGRTVKSLLREQQGKSARSVSQDMIDARDPFTWKEGQPCVRSMHGFLDAHVPDDRDDYYFADKVIEDLLEELKWDQPKQTLQRGFEIMQDNGFTPNEADMQTVLNLLMGMANGLPVWPNNGWAPDELAAASGSEQGTEDV